MKSIKLGNGFLVFILFFGIAALEAIRKVDWFWIAFWLVIGVIFLVADNMKKEKE